MALDTPVREYGIEWRSHVFNSGLFEAATHSDAAGGAFRVPRTTHELVWSEKTAPQKTVPGWSPAGCEVRNT